MFILLVLGLVGFSPCQVPATTNEDQQAQRTDAYIEREMKKQSIPGLSLVVAKEGKVLKQAAYGLASIEFGVPASLDTIYQIASATKSFTSTSIMLLVDEGKIQWSDPVEKFLPDVPQAWHGVTIDDLLTHTSGLPDVLLRPGHGPAIAETGEEAMKKLAALPLPGKPGEKWRYNQTNYFLLVQIIEKVSGTAFETFCQQRIFQPLGMTKTCFADSRDIVAGRATSYEVGEDKKLRTRWVTFPKFLHGAAGINSTAPELLRWLESLAGDKLIKKETRAHMWETVKLRDGKIMHFKNSLEGYARGFASNDRPGHRSVGHSGGGTAAFRYFIDDHLAVIVLLNGDVDPDTLLDGIAEIYIPDLAEKALK